MRHTPLFSILISNYNNGQYLQDAINSVLCQTYTNWEIIIVDDGSTDNSKELYHLFQDDQRIHIYYNNENKGCGYTKRRCVELAQGELCGFLDADDVLLSNALNDHASVHLQYPEVSCIFSRFYYCDQKLTITGESRQLTIPQDDTYFTHRDYLPEHFASFKKKTYNKTAGINETLVAAVDQDLYFKLEEISPVKVLNTFTYKYRMTGCQVSQGNKWIQAFYWNLIVRHNTCQRRGLNDEDYPMSDLSDRIMYYEKECDSLQDEIFRLRSTMAYRIGKALIQPFKWIKKR